MDYFDEMEIRWLELGGLDEVAIETELAAANADADAAWKWCERALSDKSWSMKDVAKYERDRAAHRARIRKTRP